MRKQVSRLCRFSVKVKNYLVYHFRMYQRKRALSKRFLKAIGQPRILLMATPLHGNLGDQAIVCAENRILSVAFPGCSIIEITNDEYRTHSAWIAKTTVPEDIIVIDGGGNLGTLWPREDDKITDIVRRFSNNRIFIFPQTCYYGGEAPYKERLSRNCDAYRSARNLTIMLRDGASFDFCQNHFSGVRCVLVPDIVLSLEPEYHGEIRNGALLCLRDDLETALKETDREWIRKCLSERGVSYRNTSTLVHKTVDRKNRRQEVENKLLEFSSAEIIVTDRLHAMIFAAITGTPCVALDNQSKKVSGVYRWIDSLAHIRVISAPEELPEAIETVMKVQEPARYKYPNEALMRLLRGGDFE